MAGSQIEYSLVIPVFNEASNIDMLYRRVTEVMKGMGDNYEIVLVDDGSQDASFELLDALAKTDRHVVVIKFKRNFGQHPAVVAGLMFARGDTVITIDADLQNPPEEIPRMIDVLRSGYDAVTGRRAQRKDNLLRLAIGVVSHFIVRTLTGVEDEDFGSMQRVFTRKVAKDIAKLFCVRQLYITMYVPKATKNIKVIDVAHEERFSGESKYNLLKMATTFRRIFVAKTVRVDDAVIDTSHVFSIELIVRDGEAITDQPEKTLSYE